MLFSRKPLKELVFQGFLCYNKDMKNEVNITTSSTEMMTISRAEYERLQQEKARNAKLEAKLAAREQEQVLRLQALELHRTADALVDGVLSHCPYTLLYMYRIPVC